MTSCEKCWKDSGGDPEEYHRLTHFRAGDPCSPEEQAGEEDARLCPKCKLNTVHVYAGRCMVENCDYMEGS